MPKLETRADKLKAVLRSTLIFTACLLSSACFADPQTIRIGVLTGPGLQIASALKAETPDEALQLDVVTFEDPTLLARDLDKRRVDVAELPNTPFLEEQTKENGYEFSIIGYTVTLPIAIYSRALTSLRALKTGDVITIPKAPVDRARALILLHNAALIKLKDEAGFVATIADVLDNPRSFQIQERKAEDLAASLDMAAAAVVPFENAARSSLDPARNALLAEDGHSPYAEILVVKFEDRDKSWGKQLVNAYHSEKMKSFLLTRFNGAVRRPW